MREDEALWRKYAQVYDELLKLIPYQSLLLDVVGRASIKPGMRVLDACCGTANLLWALDHMNIPADVTGLDFTPAMLSRGVAKVAKYRGTAHLQKANLDEPVESWGTTGLFDRFIFNNSLCLIAEPSQVLQKASTLAADGALLVASTPRPNPSVDEVLDEHLMRSARAGLPREVALQQIVTSLQPLIECNVAMFERYGDSYHLPAKAQLVEWFEGSGWNIIDIDVTYAGQNWLVVAEKDSTA
jgi:ubiquinone/menaquinone biosynthesis C-methylase UbiE